MKYFNLVLIMLFCCNFAFALPMDDVVLDSYVNDYAGVLLAEDIDQLYVIADSLNKNGAAELAIVIVDNMDGMSKEDYAIGVAHNNLGDSNLDNGLLILIAIEDREYRVEVGYGLEGDLNDAKIGRMSRSILVPSFSVGDFAYGLIAFTLDIHKILLADTEIAVFVPSSRQVDSNLVNSIGYLVFFLVYFIFRLGSQYSYYKKHKKGKTSDDGFFTAALIASMFMRPGGGMGGGGMGGFGGGGFGGGGFGGSF